MQPERKNVLRILNIQNYLIFSNFETCSTFGDAILRSTLGVQPEQHEFRALFLSQQGSQIGWNR